MSKKIFVLSTSPRKGGNSDALANQFIKGAVQAGHDAEKVCLYDKTIRFCTGCLSCQKTGRCIIRDDAEEIVQKMCKADVLVFATPVYFYAMCGQMKTLLDRSNPLFPANYAFRKIYLLASAADADAGAMDGVQKGLQGWIDCFEKAQLAGSLCATAVTNCGDIQTQSDVLKQAYLMGQLA